MQVENIACNSCGAPLEVSATTQFATCRHCGAKLSIQRTNTAIFTEILEKLTTKTDQLSEQVNNLSDLNELAALDREWEMEREHYMVTTKHGGRHIPSEAGSIGAQCSLRCLVVSGQ
jgi:DNA-directed RNA polymerase subunit RPC12/RpoP